MAGGMIASLIFNGVEMAAEAAQRASLLKKYKQEADDCSPLPGCRTAFCDGKPFDREVFLEVHTAAVAGTSHPDLDLIRYFSDKASENNENKEFHELLLAVEKAVSLIREDHAPSRKKTPGELRAMRYAYELYRKFGNESPLAAEAVRMSYETTIAETADELTKVSTVSGDEDTGRNALQASLDSLISANNAIQDAKNYLSAHIDATPIMNRIEELECRNRNDKNTLKDLRAAHSKTLFSKNNIPMFTPKEEKQAIKEKAVESMAALSKDIAALEGKIKACDEELSELKEKVSSWKLVEATGKLFERWPILV